MHGDLGRRPALTVLFGAEGQRSMSWTGAGFAISQCQSMESYGQSVYGVTCTELRAGPSLSLSLSLCLSFISLSPSGSVSVSIRRFPRRLIDVSGRAKQWSTSKTIIIPVRTRADGARSVFFLSRRYEIVHVDRTERRGGGGNGRSCRPPRERYTVRTTMAAWGPTTARVARLTDIGKVPRYSSL